MKRILIVLFLFLIPLYASKDAFADENSTYTFTEEEEKEMSGKLNRGEISQEDYNAYLVKSYVEKVKTGKPIEHKGFVVDLEQLNKLKGSDVNNFEFVFVGDDAGFKVSDGVQTYSVMMSEKRFETFLCGMLLKESGKEEERPENPHEWVFKDPFPTFYVTRSNGDVEKMTDEEDAKKMYDTMFNTIFKFDDNKVISIGGILDSYNDVIANAVDGGGIAGKVVSGCVIGIGKLWCNTVSSYRELLSDLSEKYDFKDHFVGLVMKGDDRRAEALKEFLEEQERAIAEYDEKQRIEAERLADEERRQKYAIVAECVRRADMVSVNEIEEVEIKTKVADYFGVPTKHMQLKFKDSNSNVFTIFVIGREVSEGSVNQNDMVRPIQPEEWVKIVPFLEKHLYADQKSDLGGDFFTAIQQKSRSAIVAVKRGDLDEVSLLSNVPNTPPILMENMKNWFDKLYLDKESDGIDKEKIEKYALCVCNNEKASDTIDCDAFWDAYEEKHCPTLRKKWSTCDDLERAIKAEDNCQICKSSSCSEHPKRRLTTKEDEQAYARCCAYEYFPLARK